MPGGPWHGQEKQLWDCDLGALLFPVPVAQFMDWHTLRASDFPENVCAVCSKSLHGPHSHLTSKKYHPMLQISIYHACQRTCHLIQCQTRVALHQGKWSRMLHKEGWQWGWWSHPTCNPKRVHRCQCTVAIIEEFWQQMVMSPVKLKIKQSKYLLFLSLQKRCVCATCASCKKQQLGILPRWRVVVRLKTHLRFWDAWMAAVTKRADR